MKRFLGLTFLMNATEKVSQETMLWSISSTKAVKVKDSKSPKLKGRTHRDTQTIGRFSLADGLEQCIICKALMAWKATRGER